MNTSSDAWTETGPRSEERILRGSWQIRTATEIRAIRRVIVDMVTAHTGDPDVTLAAVSQRLATVFAELAANALRHAAGPVTATLHYGCGSWLLSVVDQAPERAPRPRARSTDHRGGGLGLIMVELLSGAVGWDASGPSKRVWALVDEAVPPQLSSRLQVARP